jgi:hypothetical protein
MKPAAKRAVGSKKILNLAFWFFSTTKKVARGFDDCLCLQQHFREENSPSR